MRNIFVLVSLLLFLNSCSEKKDTIDPYYIKFQLRGSDGLTHAISIPQETPQTLFVSGIKDSELGVVEFAITGTFTNPTKKARQNVSFYLSTEIPESAFSVDARGNYRLKDPAIFRSNFSAGNLFANGSWSVSTYFLEDDQTYCSARLTSDSSNTFSITKTSFYVDNTGESIVDINGEFNTVYDPLCGSADIKLNDGTFRVKLLLNAMSSDE